MTPEMVALHKFVRETHASIYEQLRALRQDASKTRDIKVLSDLGFVLVRLLRFIDDERKELNFLKTTIDKAICTIYSQQESLEPIRTYHVTAQPELKMMAHIPHRKRNREDYEKMMTSLGVPQNLWGDEDDKHGVVEPHWNGLLDYISELAARGKPLPDGVRGDKMYPVYNVIYRGQKEVEEPVDKSSSRG